MRNALILVDIQNDFIPGGALAVTDGDAVVPVANQLMPRFDLVIATQDWHPADHSSFASQHEGRKPGDIITLNGLPQVMWPDHCVENTNGAEFVSDLETAHVTKVFRKGMDRNADSYSGFFDNHHAHDTGLGDYLRARQVEGVTVMGLALDYCVKYTVLDARQLGFRATLILEGVKGVELNAGDCENALNEMADAGVRIAGVDEV